MPLSDRIGVGFLSGLLLVVAACGCGDSKPAVDTTVEEATVTGTVTIKGKKATRGRVTFDPSNYKRKVGSREATIGKDGTYSITTLLGRNEVSVDSPEMGGSREMDDLTFVHEVKSGTNTYDIVVTPPR